MIALAPGHRSQARYVGAAARLGDGERGDFLARKDLRQHARLHLFRAVVQDRRRADRVAEEAGRHPPATGAGDLLHRDDAHEPVALGSAVALGKSEPHVTDLGCFPVELARKLAGLVPVVGEGLDLARDEAPQALPEGFVFRLVEGARANGVEWLDHGAGMKAEDGSAFPTPPANEETRGSALAGSPIMKALVSGGTSFNRSQMNLSCNLKLASAGTPTPRSST